MSNVTHNVQLPICVVTSGVELLLLSNIIHSCVLDFALRLFPTMQLLMRRLDHSFLCLTEATKTSNPLLHQPCGPVWLADLQSILVLLNGGNIQKDSCVVLGTWFVLAHFWHVLLLGLPGGT
jgi:hypothetical protein